MATVDLTDENFRDTYSNNEIVIVDFWAIWCSPCHSFAPIYEKVSEQYPDIVFGKVNTEEQLKISQYFAIRSIPTTLIIRQGLELFRHSGVLGAQELIKIVEQVIVADMDEVIKNIAAEEEANQKD